MIFGLSVYSISRGQIDGGLIRFGDCHRYTRFSTIRCSAARHTTGARPAAKCTGCDKWRFRPFADKRRNFQLSVPALANISFGIEPGEFVILVGSSGAGKTTLLNLLAALDWPDQGEIIVDGKNIACL